MGQTEFSRTSQPSNKRRPLVGLVIIVVLCCAAFALGIFVGKQRQKITQGDELNVPVTHPVASKPEAEVALVPPAPKGDVEPLPSELVAAATAGAKKSVESVIADQELLAASAQKVGTVEPAEIAESVAASVAPVEQSPLGSGFNSAPVLPKVVAETKEVAQASVPAVAVPKVIAPQPAKRLKPSPASGSVVYVVQVGSFKKRVDAEKLQSRLQKDFSVVVRSVDLGAKGVWYRVLVGESATKELAVTLQKSLQERYKMAGFVKKTTL